MQAFKTSSPKKKTFAFMVDDTHGREGQQGVPKDGEEGRQWYLGSSTVANSTLIPLWYHKPSYCLK